MKRQIAAVILVAIMLGGPAGGFGMLRGMNVDPQAIKREWLEFIKRKLGPLQAIASTYDISELAEAFEQDDATIIERADDRTVITITSQMLGSQDVELFEKEQDPLLFKEDGKLFKRITLDIEKPILYGNPPGQYFVFTLLHYAAAFDALKIAERLIELGADVNSVAETTGSTPLMFAQSARMVSLLLKNGANPEMTDVFDKSVGERIEAAREFDRETGAARELKEKEAMIALVRNRTAQ